MEDKRSIMEANKIQVTDDQGREIEFEVLFTFKNEENGQNYVLYYDPTLDEPNVYASVYDEDGKLFEVETAQEWDMIEEVFQAFMAEDEKEYTGQQTSEYCEDDGEECCGGQENCGCHKES